MYGSFTAGERLGVVFVPRNLPKKDVLSAVEAVNFRDLLDKIYKNDEDKNHVDNEKEGIRLKRMTATKIIDKVKRIVSLGMMTKINLMMKIIKVSFDKPVLKIIVPVFLFIRFLAIYNRLYRLVII